MPQGQQGAGRHPHRKTDPSQGRSRSDSGGRDMPRSASGDDLKSREYKDPNGQIHHHTKTYMQQHGKDGGRGR